MERLTVEVGFYYEPTGFQGFWIKEKISLWYMPLAHPFDEEPTLRKISLNGFVVKNQRELEAWKAGVNLVRDVVLAQFNH